MLEASCYTGRPAPEGPPLFAVDITTVCGRYFTVCGRFTLRTPAAAWTQQFLPLWTEQERAARIEQWNVTPRYNIAPTQSISCIHAGEGRRRDWSLFRWGLIPPWADELSIGNRMINARSETAAEKRSFKQSFAEQRCLIPADGYYEWKKTPDGKQPHWITRQDGGMLAMAGLWQTNKKLGTESEPLRSCTILTTAANATTRDIHDRMPVFLDPQAQQLWLDPQIEDPDQLQSVLRPAPEDWLVPRRVSTRVNSPRTDSPECIDPVDQADRQEDLF